MAHKDLQQEMELLREQIKSIKHRSEGDKSNQSIVEKGKPITQDSSNKSSEELEIPGRLSTENLIDQFTELLDALDRDIKDAKPTTLLVVFAMGVLVGRL